MLITQSKTVTITLDDNDLKELRNQLIKIDQLWDRIEGEMKQEYVKTIIGELWRSL
jgi:tetrahydromethanopterin S-methyltransferase subunit G